jgi:hypothetical protein
MNYLIPTLLLISIVLIIRYMSKESKQKTITTVNEVELTDEQVAKIEQSIRYSVVACKPFWDNFNTLKYAEYLEYKHSKGLI